MPVSAVFRSTPLYTQTLASLGDLATASTGDDISALRDPGPVLHSAIGMVLLGVAVTLSVYKPPGLTRYGRGDRHRRRGRERKRGTVAVS